MALLSASCARSGITRLYRQSIFTSRKTSHVHVAFFRVTTELCEEVLPAEESDIRPFSDDQNIVIGYACGDERTNYLPVAHWISGELGRRLFARLRSDADLSATFGPDFKILASLEVEPGETRVEWRRLVLSVQHVPKLPYERQHRILLPLLEQILRDLEDRRTKRSGFDLRLGQTSPQWGRRIRHRRPGGDNGLSGKKLVIDHYGPGVPIGGGALAGKDPHKVDKCGALRARQLAKKLVRGGVDEARVILGWAPGGDAPFLIEASTTQGGVSLQVPRQELPPDEWFTHQVDRPRSRADRTGLGGGSAGWLLLSAGGSLGAVKEFEGTFDRGLRHFSNLVRFSMSLDDDRNWAAKIYQERADDHRCGSKHYLLFSKGLSGDLPIHAHDRLRLKG